MQQGDTLLHRATRGATWRPKPANAGAHFTADRALSDEICRASFTFSLNSKYRTPDRTAYLPLSLGLREIVIFGQHFNGLHLQPDPSLAPFVSRWSILAVQTHDNTCFLRPPKWIVRERPEFPSNGYPRCSRSVCSVIESYILKSAPTRFQTTHSRGAK